MKILLLVIILLLPIITDAKNYSKNNDISFLELTMSYNQYTTTDKTSYIGGTIMNITFLYSEENMFNLTPWGSEYCVGKVIKRDIFRHNKNEISRVGAILMYKINSIPYIDIDFGGGIMKEITFDTEYYYNITNHIGHYTGMRKDVIINNTSYKPTINCMISLDIISMFNNGVKRALIFQPNIILSTISKPVLGFNLGIKFLNF